jgi:hypothetical protein
MAATWVCSCARRSSSPCEMGLPDPAAAAPASGPIEILWREPCWQALPLKPSDGLLVPIATPACCTHTKTCSGRRQVPEVLGRLKNYLVQGSGTDHSAVGEGSVNS